MFFESFNDTFNAAPWGGMSYTGRSKAGTQLWTGVWNHIINDECFDDPRKAFSTNYTNSETFEVTDDGTLLARRTAQHFKITGYICRSPTEGFVYTNITLDNVRAPTPTDFMPDAGRVPCPPWYPKSKNCPR